MWLAVHSSLLLAGGAAILGSALNRLRYLWPSVSYVWHLLRYRCSTADWWCHWHNTTRSHNVNWWRSCKICASSRHFCVRSVVILSYQLMCFWFLHALLESKEISNIFSCKNCHEFCHFERPTFITNNLATFVFCPPNEHHPGINVVKRTFENGLSCGCNGSFDHEHFSCRPLWIIFS